VQRQLAGSGGGLAAPRRSDALLIMLGAVGFFAGVGTVWVASLGSDRQLLLPGAPVERPDPSGGRLPTVVERDGQPIAMLICDPALEHNSALVDSVCAAASLSLDNERLQAELRARLAELAGSTIRWPISPAANVRCWRLWPRAVPTRPSPNGFVSQNTLLKARQEIAAAPTSGQRYSWRGVRFSSPDHRDSVSGNDLGGDGRL
jgi:hypothetical protein